MTAMAHDFDPATAAVLPAASGFAPDAAGADRLALRWEAVLEAAAAVAALARMTPPAPDAATRALPRRAAATGGWTAEMVARGIEDLAAVMQPGLRALIALTARGTDSGPAAAMLWSEFARGRDALVALLPEG